MNENQDTSPQETPIPGLSYVSDRLLAPKELAYLLSRHVSYVYLMKRAGFPMPNSRATLKQALDWLTVNPHWRKEKLPYPHK